MDNMQDQAGRTASDEGTQTGRFDPTFNRDLREASMLMRFFDGGTQQQVCDVVAVLLGIVMNPETRTLNAAALCSRIVAHTPEVLLGICDTIDSNPESTPLQRDTSRIFRMMTNATARLHGSAPAAPAEGPHPGSIDGILDTLRRLGVDVQVIKL